MCDQHRQHSRMNENHYQPNYVKVELK